jgi:hypothetical protein
MPPPKANQISPPKANQIDSPAPPVPPIAPQPVMSAGIAAPSAAAPPPWSVDFVRPVPANSGGQRASRSPDDDVAATDPDKVLCEQLAKLM